MLLRIISFSIRNKLIIGLGVLALIIGGIVELTRLPIDAVPDITDNQVQVMTITPALGAPDVERLVTSPIEQFCNNIPGTKNMRSFSRSGLSLVTIVFEEGVDVYWARQQINERLQQVRQALPEGIGTPEMAPVTTGLGEIYQYVVKPLPGYEKKYDAMRLRTIQDGLIRRQLLGTQGVADVSSFGGYLKQYEISVNSSRLSAYNLSISEIFRALEENNENTGGAYIEKGPTVLYIRTEGLTKSLDDIEKIAIKNLNSGVPVLIRDVATVGFGHAPRYGAMCYNDEGEVAGAVVMMLKGENSSAVIRNVKKRIAEIQLTLPKGIIIEPFLDRTKMVDNAIRTVKINLTEGALIVLLVLIFFLGNIRAGLIVASVIPLSMLFAVILMNRFHVSGNLMSLGAIDFGIIVDGSVIVVEAILHRFAFAKDFSKTTLLTQKQMDEEVTASTGSMIRSAAFSQIIILIVYLPILSLEGIEGKMFKPMAYTISFAVIGAFLLSVTYVPMISSLLLSKRISHKLTLAEKLMAWLSKKYEPVLQLVLSYRKTTILATLALAITAFFLFSRMGGEFIPELEEGDFAVEARVLTGSNLNTTIGATQKAAAILIKKYPEVEKVVTKIGSSEIPTDPMPIEASDMMVILKDKREWTSAKTFNELAAKMKNDIAVVPGLQTGFQYPVQMRFNELMTGARQDVVCKIFGDNLDTLRLYAERLGRIITTVNGATDLYVETVTGVPQIVIHFNRNKLAQYGLNIKDLNNTINTAFAGHSAGLIYEGEQRFDLVVRLEKNARRNIIDIQNLLIPIDNHVQIPLSQVATVEEIEGPNQIQRENARRRIIVGFNVGGTDTETIVADLQNKVAHEIKFPPGYYVKYGGAFENLKAAKERLLIVVPVALLLIFVMLYFAFNSLTQGILIYSAIPLSAIGGILSLYWREMPFSISAGVGFIALFGVAVLNGILLIGEFNALKKVNVSGLALIIQGTKNKMRAILMTALVPAFGFIPMAVSNGAGAEVQKPLATVVIGGLLFSMVLTLFVLPTLYTYYIKGWTTTSKKGIFLIIVLGCMLAPSGLSAQKKITLNEAIDAAVKNNNEIKISRLNQQYYEVLKKSSFDPEKTEFSFEFGQVNSKAQDNKFSITQTIQFPTVYSNQRQINSELFNISLLNTTISEIQITAEVKQVFYSIVVMNARKKLLKEASDLYGEAAGKVTRRLSAGDTDVLESSLMQNQKLQVDQQLSGLNADLELLYRRLRFLLNTSESIEPYPDSVSYNAAAPIQLNETTPFIQRMDSEYALSLHEYHLQRSMLLPSISGGYNNLSFVGFQRVGDHEKYFHLHDRFVYWGVGLGIPVFNKASRSRIRAAKVAVQISKSEAEVARLSLNLEFETNMITYTNLSQQKQSFESGILPNAATILNGAAKRLQLGDINYIEWVLLVNHSIQVQANYLDIIQQRNDTLFKLEQLTAESPH